jgi:hypothetical protein
MIEGLFFHGKSPTPPPPVSDSFVSYMYTWK